MGADSPTTDLVNCPECGAKLKTIIYGMLAEDPGPEYIVGGCMMGPELTTLACSKCEWEGGGNTDTSMPEAPSTN